MDTKNYDKKKELLRYILDGKIKSDVKRNGTVDTSAHRKSGLLSHAQYRMWFLYQLNPNDVSYNMYSILKLVGALNIEALSYSLLKVVEKHDILRTNIRMDSKGEPFQLVRDTITPKIEIIDMQKCSEDFLQQNIDRMIKKPFDLENDLLIRSDIIKRTETCYYLVVSMHHIISDGWSLGILSRELMLYYHRYLQGDFSVDSLKHQYLDYAYWQQQYISSERLERQCQYWKSQLSDLPESLELKTKSGCDTELSNYARKYIFLLEKDKLKGLKELSKREGTTLYMTLLAVFSVVLNKYSFQEDFIIGTPIANRRRKEWEELIGLFVNTLPIRIRINPMSTFQVFLHEVKNTAVNAFANQDIPFDYIIKEIAGERYSENVPMIQTMFVLQNTQNTEIELPDVKVELKFLENTTAKFNLLLTAVETEEGLRFCFEYRNGLYQPELIGSLADKFFCIIDEITDQSQKCISELACKETPIINQDILFDLVKSFKENSIIDRFHKIAMENGSKVAVDFQNELLTYSELEEQSNQLSRFIDRYKGNSEGFIGICMERSIDMIVSILSILKSNCTYVPLDPDSPKERLEFIIKDANLQLIIGNKKKMEGIIIPDETTVIDLADCQTDLMQEAGTHKIEERTQQSSAYMIYTSGSTGNPKGVTVSDNNVLRLFSNTEQLYHFSSQDIWTMFHSVAFDFSVWEIWGALLYGGKLIIVPYDISRDSEAFLKLLVDKKVTVLNQTPSAFRQLLQCEKIFEKETVVNLSLKYIIFGGEALDFVMLEHWMEVYGDSHPLLVNMYGITETTVHVTYEVLNHEMIKKVRRSLIGKPIKDLSIYILDSSMRLVPDGVIGEMYVGGAGVSKGYWKRKKLNQERFIQNPFATDPDILYRTGDLACKNIDGTLEYIGRNDGQVKVKGFRIELNEIKEQINTSSLVKDNLVVLDKVADDARLISYIVLDKDTKGTLVKEILSKDDYNREIREVFDYNYEQEYNLFDESFNIIGWNNSYDNEPIPEHEMQEWLDSICYKLSGLSMQKVLDVGVGTGMILHRFAPKVDLYVGIDSSKEAIKYNKKIIEKNKLNYKNVKLIHTTVEDLSEKIDTMFDTIIINSVVQYFPDVNYFENVLSACIDQIKSKGQIIIGDIRSFDRLDMYYLSVELYGGDEKKFVTDLRRNMEKRRKNEKELIFSSQYFRGLEAKIPEIINVSITPKTGHADNELSKFRYDVILFIDKSEEESPESECAASIDLVEWDGFKIDRISLKKDIVHITKVPDKRVSYEMRFLDIMSKADRWIAVESIEKLAGNAKIADPNSDYLDDIKSFAKQQGCELYIGMDYHPGYLEVVYYKPHVKIGEVVKYLNRCCDKYDERTTEPMNYKVQYLTVKKIKNYLKEKLPYYMIPNEFVLLEKIPLTINGKIDYKALPKPNIVSSSFNSHERFCEDAVARDMIQIWEKLLNIDQVGLHDNFFLLGGHSLLATNLIFSIHDVFGINIPLKYLFEKPTVFELCKYISSKTSLQNPLPEKKLELEKEIRLPENLLVPERETLQLQHILVTGATGFFGTFLVHSLLKKTKAILYCLVRADNVEHAKKRLINALLTYKVYDESYEERIVVLCGDLSIPCFGLDQNQYNFYARQIDLIIHNGARINFFEPYEKLKATNVNGTVEIIQFASIIKAKPIHFISSLYVYESSAEKEDVRVITEQQPLSGYERLRMGYTQSKWVAERILELAREKGLPINIYRLGRISGHSNSGACQQNDFLWTLVKGCIEIGKYPAQNISFEFMPVDFLADAVVTIVKSGELNENYHLFNRQKTSLKNIVHVLSEHYKMRAVDSKLWRSYITSTVNSAQLVSQLLLDDTFEGGYLQFENDSASRHMPYFRNGIEVNSQMLKALRDYFMEIGYFPERVT